MTTTADTLPDDPGTLKAMLLAERARAERLEQIIKELQRHRFGRRAETLPEDQLLLGLEEVEQVEASSEAEIDVANADRAIHPGCQASQEPGIVAGASAAHRDGGRHRRSGLPVLPERAAPDRRGCERAAGHRPGPVPRDGRAPPEVCLPGLRERGAGAGAGAADRGRAADRSDGRAGARLQICRSPAAVSASPDLRPPGHQPGSLDPGRLGRPRRLPAAAGARAAARQAQGIGQAVRRRDDRAGARSRTRAHQDRPAMGLRPR